MVYKLPYSRMRNGSEAKVDSCQSGVSYKHGETEAVRGHWAGAGRARSKQPEMCGGGKEKGTVGWNIYDRLSHGAWGCGLQADCR